MDYICQATVTYLSGWFLKFPAIIIWISKDMKNVYNKTFSCLKLFFCICFIELNFWMARDLILCPFKGSSFGIFNLDITLYITLPHYHIYYPIPHVPLMCNTPSLKNRPFLKRQEVGPLTSQVSPCYATLRFEWVFV